MVQRELVERNLSYPPSPVAHIEDVDTKATPILGLVDHLDPAPIVRCKIARGPPIGELTERDDLPCFDVNRGRGRGLLLGECDVFGPVQYSVSTTAAVFLRGLAARYRSRTRAAADEVVGMVGLHLMAGDEEITAMPTTPVTRP